MQHTFITHSGAPRLILLFAGWGMDSRPFAGLRRDGYDIAVVWNYTSLDIDWSFTAVYGEICVVGWSLGVFAAAVTTRALEPRTSARIAVNGTLSPVDGLRGIAPHIFEGTLDGLNERNLMKFRRRMCGSAAAYAAFMEKAPTRGIDDLREELSAFEPEATWFLSPLRRCDAAIVGRNDAIFPCAAQWRAWRGVPTEINEGHHLPDFQAIIDRHILDKARVEERFGSGLHTYTEAAHVQRHVAEALTAAMTEAGAAGTMQRRGARVLELGSGTGSLSRRLDAIAGTDTYIETWDLAGEACLAGPRRHFRRTDAETGLWNLPSESFDVIASASTVQWFNSPTRFLAESSRVCAPGGYVAFSAFVRGNLREVSAATHRTLPLLSIDEWLALVPEGMTVSAARQWDEYADFGSAIDAFRHLKATGVNALGRDSEGEQNIFKAIRRMQPYLDGVYRLTYRPFIIILRKKQ